MRHLHLVGTKVAMGYRSESSISSLVKDAQHKKFSGLRKRETRSHATSIGSYHRTSKPKFVTLTVTVVELCSEHIEFARGIMIIPFNLRGSESRDIKSLQIQILKWQNRSITRGFSRSTDQSDESIPLFLRSPFSNSNATHHGPVHGSLPLRISARRQKQRSFPNPSGYLRSPR
jgi:hypothetical protein